MRIWEKILCSWACAAYCQNCEPNSHASRVRARFSVLPLCSPTHGFSNKCLFCNARRWLSTLSPIYKLRKTLDFPTSIAISSKGNILKYCSFVICPYRRKSPAMYNKHSVGNFGPFVSIADRAEALPEHAKRVSWPEPCLIGGGTKGPENCRECVYTWRGSFGPF